MALIKYVPNDFYAAGYAALRTRQGREFIPFYAVANGAFRQQGQPPHLGLELAGISRPVACTVDCGCVYGYIKIDFDRQLKYAKIFCLTGRNMPKSRRVCRSRCERE